MALVLASFLMMLMGGIELGRYLFTLESLQVLAETAGRYGVVNGWGTQSDACTAAGDLISNQSLPAGIAVPPFVDPQVTTLCVGTDLNDGVISVSVLATASFTSYIPGVTGLTGTLQAKSQYSY